MNKKYMNFGFGLALCGLLTAFLLYGIYVVFAEENQQQIYEGTQEQESFSFAVKGQASFMNTQGEEIGTAQLEENANGVLIRINVSNLPGGYHAIHIHERGNCTPRYDDNTQADEPGTPVAYFSNAGSHLNPGEKEHGLLSEEGPHAGDLTNIHVNADGTAEAQLFNDRVTLQSDNQQGLANLLDDDGAALIIHSGTDDYKTSPTGRAGDRLACAIIEGS